MVQTVMSGDDAQALVDLEVGVAAAGDREALVEAAHLLELGPCGRTGSCSPTRRRASRGRPRSARSRRAGSRRRPPDLLEEAVLVGLVVAVVHGVALLARPDVPLLGGHDGGGVGVRAARPKRSTPGVTTCAPSIISANELAPAGADALVQGRHGGRLGPIAEVEVAELGPEAPDEALAEALVGVGPVLDDDDLVGGVLDALLVGAGQRVQRALGLAAHVVDDDDHAQVDGVLRGGGWRGDGWPTRTRCARGPARVGPRRRRRARRWPWRPPARAARRCRGSARNASTCARGARARSRRCAAGRQAVVEARRGSAVASPRAVRPMRSSATCSIAAPGSVSAAGPWRKRTRSSSRPNRAKPSRTRLRSARKPATPAFGQLGRLLGVRRGAEASPRPTPGGPRSRGRRGRPAGRWRRPAPGAALHQVAGHVVGRRRRRGWTAGGRAGAGPSRCTGRRMLAAPSSGPAGPRCARAGAGVSRPARCGPGRGACRPRAVWPP